MSYCPVQGQDCDGKVYFSSNLVDLLTRDAQLDAGQHAGYEGLASLPFYDDFDLSTVDILLISQ